MLNGRERKTETGRFSFSRPTTEQIKQRIKNLKLELNRLEKL